MINMNNMEERLSNSTRITLKCDDDSYGACLHGIRKSLDIWELRFTVQGEVYYLPSEIFYFQNTIVDVSEIREGGKYIMTSHEKLLSIIKNAKDYFTLTCLYEGFVDVTEDCLPQFPGEIVLSGGLLKRYYDTFSQYVDSPTICFTCYDIKLNQTRELWFSKGNICKFDVNKQYKIKLNEDMTFKMEEIC